MFFIYFFEWDCGVQDGMAVASDPHKGVLVEEAELVFLSLIRFGCASLISASRKTNLLR